MCTTSYTLILFSVSVKCICVVTSLTRIFAFTQVAIAYCNHKITYRIHSLSLSSTPVSLKIFDLFTVITWHAFVLRLRVVCNEEWRTLLIHHRCTFLNCQNSLVQRFTVNPFILQTVLQLSRLCWWYLISVGVGPPERNSVMYKSDNSSVICPRWSLSVS